MGNVCQTIPVKLALITEVSDEQEGHQTIMTTSNRAIFNELYKQEKFEPKSTIQPQPQMTSQQCIFLDLVETSHYASQTVGNQRKRSFIIENSPKYDQGSRTTSENIGPKNMNLLKNPIKPSLKSLSSKQGSPQKRKKSVRWESDLSVLGITSNTRMN
ncbi:unnamed protein product (macronuclear) [Paramecium tetraurelia]|uniref:Kinesin motor domain-containing protein n=1 Tax=Paramecium tetraurelia TaxID=5888 RepID=A0CPF6_PARTE|nr:uncharacterized protein GSPATT00009065001 [Paramecium tetraurelia]CAK72673.1 unnamed protein product [Paramecium tetraurelia]|eukprot:XP_001440070.1 hypothetical protein (macronuclear) [Paramecium tetraurelia strain d4-2]